MIPVHRDEGRDLGRYAGEVLVVEAVETGGDERCEGGFAC